MNQTIYNKLKALKPILKEKFGIEEFVVFGSVARGNDTPESDVDIAITKSKKKNYFDMLESCYFLEKQLDRKVDMGYFDAIRPIIKKHIAKDMIYV